MSWYLYWRKADPDGKPVPEMPQKPLIFCLFHQISTKLTALCKAPWEFNAGATGPPFAEWLRRHLGSHEQGPWQQLSSIVNSSPWEAQGRELVGLRKHVMRDTWARLSVQNPIPCWLSTARLTSRLAFGACESLFLSESTKSPPSSHGLGHTPDVESQSIVMD